MAANINGYPYEQYRNSAVIAHRLSIYMSNIFLPSKNPQKLISDINSHVALFRDMLIHVGQSKDSPDLREKIRKYRHICVDEFKHAVDVIIDLVKSTNLDVTCTPHDTSHLTPLLHLLQIFSNELLKSYRLIQIIPMDMSRINENRSRPTNFGNVLGQLLLCKQINPDFRSEELCSIANDINDMELLITEIQKIMPISNMDQRKSSTSIIQFKRHSDAEKSQLLCCISRPKYA
ncbi:uncharacterized protein LOC142227199 [Haematobia irritans]|uniref:uncharacterized protein LOC142227199 n=1 Tax=Haematobia irritans TaxID=7368 RepID=UPI003F503AA1